MRKTLPFLSFSFLILFLSISTNAYALRVVPYPATPDQVLVLYNADWQEDEKGTLKGQDSKELAEYYARMHTDSETGKRPYLLGLKCRHKPFDKDLNNWFIKEESNDNGNGIVYKGNGNGIAYKGRGRAPHAIMRDLRKVEIKIDEPSADLDSIQVSIRSVRTKEKVAVQKASVDIKSRGYHIKKLKDSYLFSMDASKFFSGEVAVFFSIKDKGGKIIKKLELPYYDYLDFEFSEVGADGIADDKIVEEDVLSPVKKFLKDPANALPSGVLLKDHILYIVVMRGMPYSAKGVFGIERGATADRRDHGSLGSLEQRLQTLYYDWNGTYRPPVTVMSMKKGPDFESGVVNHVITTAMRRSLMGRRWNPYMHKNTYSYLKHGSPVPEFYNIPPLRVHRELVRKEQFAYGVTRIDGTNLNEAKRIIDYSLYATKYLRPEMDCRVRAGLAAEGKDRITNLEERMRKAEEEGLWGMKELEALGFIMEGNKWGGRKQGLPFLARPVGEEGACDKDAKVDWSIAGFYPGGIERRVISHNGLNYKKAAIWRHLEKGVTVSAAGAPAYSGGPHITNGTFWDNRILMRYLLRGRDLGGVFLNSSLYVNWSTSLIGDPLMHPDLTKTSIDKTQPKVKADISLEQYGDFKKINIEISTSLDHSRDKPEVALLKVTLMKAGGDKVEVVSPLYSARPVVTLEGLMPDTEYDLTLTLIDPYGNRTKLPERRIKTQAVD